MAKNFVKSNRGNRKGGKGGKGRSDGRSSSPGNRDAVTKKTPPADKSGQVVLCRFYNTDGGCLKGKDCIFRHENKPKDDRSLTPGKGGKKGKGKGSGSREASVNTSYCHLHLKPDGCPYGASCRFQHVSQGEAIRLDTLAGKANGKGVRKETAAVKGPRRVPPQDLRLLALSGG